ncbi:MAG TPA: ATP-binding protein, partial [Bryobacteraceae bacterium]|nr:ATP-binding protein [Bryobacteraceae bacterium]
RSVSAYSELLKSRAAGRLDPEGEMFLAEVLSGASRMHCVIEGVCGYTLALRDDESSEAVSAQLALRAVLVNLAAEIRSNQAEIQAGTLPRLQISLERLIQVFENLIQNSLKFRREEPPLILISAREENDGDWVIRVSDNGMGIDHKDMHCLFRPFTRVHGKKYPGAGLGLSICKKIVERHGGSIWAESQPGMGSTFYFGLPAGD